MSASFFFVRYMSWHIWFMIPALSSLYTLFIPVEKNQAWLVQNYLLIDAKMPIKETHWWLLWWMWYCRPDEVSAAVLQATFGQDRIFRAVRLWILVYRKRWFCAFFFLAHVILGCIYFCVSCCSFVHTIYHPFGNLRQWRDFLRVDWSKLLCVCLC